MYKRIPVLAVVGHKNSGKTAVIENIVRELTRRGCQVATAKHVNQKGFSMDTEGKDTWRHSAVGANPVVSVSDIETGILIKNGLKRFSLDQLFSFTPEADIIVLEGFSRMVLNDERVGKIFCVRDRKEYEDFVERTRGKIIASCSVQPMRSPVLRIREDSPILVKRASKFIKRERKISDILNRLPGLNCRKCGHLSCEEMAVAIYRRKAKLSDCVTLRLRSKLKTRITIDDVEVPIQPFVSEVIRNALLGMISSLKGVSVRGSEKVHVKILS